MEITLNISALFVIVGSNFLGGLGLGYVVGKFNERREWNKLVELGPDLTAKGRISE